MPRFLGRDITQHQHNEMQGMVRRWRSESQAFLREIEGALTTRFRRNPDELGRVLDRLAQEIRGTAKGMRGYKALTKSSGSIDALISTADDVAGAVSDAAAVVRAYAGGDASSSEAAEELRDLLGSLREYAKAESDFKAMRALTNMLSDALADDERPSQTKVSKVDFTESLKRSHKLGEYKSLIRRVPSAARVDRWALARLPVVPLISSRPKSEEFKGIMMDVDPIVFEDAEGKVRSRYLVFKDQLILLANATWIMGIQREDKSLREPKALADFIQSEMDSVARDAATLPGTPGVAVRERLIGQRLVTEIASGHDKAPGFTLFWLAPKRRADRLLAKVRRVINWTIALP